MGSSQTGGHGTTEAFTRPRTLRLGTGTTVCISSARQRLGSPKTPEKLRTKQTTPTLFF